MKLFILLIGICGTATVFAGGTCWCGVLGNWKGTSSECCSRYTTCVKNDYKFKGCSGKLNDGRQYCPANSNYVQMCLY